jgi:hypothetical protein
VQPRMGVGQNSAIKGDAEYLSKLCRKFHHMIFPRSCFAIAIRVHSAVITLSAASPCTHSQMRTWMGCSMSAFRGRADMAYCSAKCPLMTQSGHANHVDQCHFLKKQTWTATITRRRDLNHTSSLPARALFKNWAASRVVPLPV